MSETLGTLCYTHCFYQAVERLLIGFLFFPSAGIIRSNSICSCWGWAELSILASVRLQDKSLLSKMSNFFALNYSGINIHKS